MQQLQVKSFAYFVAKDGINDLTTATWNVLHLLIPWKSNIKYFSWGKKYVCDYIHV